MTVGDFHSAECSMEDHQMTVILVSSILKGPLNLWIHWWLSVMCQDGSAIQDKLTKRGESQDKARGGKMMEAYTLVDSRMATGQKGESTSCNQITLTHFSIPRVMTQEIK
jgi:hypothetical protein